MQSAGKTPKVSHPLQNFFWVEIGNEDQGGGQAEMLDEIKHELDRLIERCGWQKRLSELVD